MSLPADPRSEPGRLQPASPTVASGPVHEGSLPGPAPAPPAAARPARRGADWRERGAASAELVGTLFVVVLVMGALLTAAAPGGALTGAFESMFCRAFSSFGMECGSDTPTDAADSREPTEVCVVATDQTTKTLGVTVAFVDLDGGGQLAVETIADGTYRVTYQGQLQGGVSAGAGGGVQVTVDDENYGGLLSAGAGAGAVIDGGMIWEVGTEAEKDAMVEYFEEEMANATTPVWGDAMNLWNVMPWVDRYSPPAPTSIYGEVGAYGNGSAGATALDQSASASANFTAALGVESNLETGEVTTYYQVDGKAAAAAHLDSGGGPMDGSADGSYQNVIAVTLSPDGEYLTNVEIQGTLFGAADGSYNPLFGPEFSGDASGGQVLNASVDLTQDESLSIATDLLRGAGIPVPPGVSSGGGSPEGPASFFDAAQTFVGAAQDRGELWRQEIDGDSNTPFALDASGKIGIGLGARYNNSNSQTNVTGADYWDGQAWAPWVSCHS